MKSHDGRRRAGRYQSITNLTLTTLVLLLAALFWYDSGRRGQVQIAVAKGQQLFAAGGAPYLALDYALVQAIAAADAGLAVLLSDKDSDFVNAIPLSASEASPWRGAGCDGDNCVQVVFYDYS